MKKVYVFYVTEEGLSTCNRGELDDIFLVAFPDCITENIEYEHVTPYAYTFQKSRAKIFRETHNMEYFREKKIFIQDHEVEDFKLEYDELELRYSTFQSAYVDPYNEVTNTKEYTILTTYFEEQKINFETDTFIWFIFSEILIRLGIPIPDPDMKSDPHSLFEIMANPYLLKPKYRKLLDSLRFFDILEFIVNPEEWGYNIAMYVDKIQLYEYVYGPLYKKGGIEKLCVYGGFI